MNHPFHVSGIHFHKIKTKPLLHMNKEVKVESVREGLKKSDFYHLGGGGGVRRGQLSLFIFYFFCS